MRSPIGELSQIAPFSLFCMTKRRKNNVDKINLLGLQERVVVGKGLEGKAKLGRSTYFNLRIRCEQWYLVQKTHDYYGEGDMF